MVHRRGIRPLDRFLLTARREGIDEQRTDFSTREKVAVGVSGAIILGAIIYWIVQIVGVIEIWRWRTA